MMRQPGQEKQMWPLSSRVRHRNRQQLPPKNKTLRQNRLRIPQNRHLPEKARKNAPGADVRAVEVKAVRQFRNAIRVTKAPPKPIRIVRWKDHNSCLFIYSDDLPIWF